MKKMKTKKNDNEQTTVEDFLSGFSVSDPRPNRDVWTPTRNELHRVTLTGTVEVTNDYGTSTMNTVLVGDDNQEMVWFCKGYENSDMKDFLHDLANPFPVEIKFVRTQNQSSKNSDRMVNRLFVKLA